MAFGEGEVPRHLSNMDWHQYSKSKVRWVCSWFGLSDTFSSMVAFVWLSGPAEHLLQQVQHIDVCGGALRDILSNNSNTNAFLHCLRAYADFVREPLASLPEMWRHFEQMGCRECAVIAWVQLCLILRIASGIWRDVWMVLSEFPYAAAGLTVDNHLSAHPVFDDYSARLFGKSACCLDRGFSANIVRLANGSATHLLALVGLLASIRLWSQRSRLTNMCTERLIKMFTCSSPPRPSGSRFCAAGLLAQVQHAHLGAGGDDIRKILRRDLKAEGARLLAQRRAAKRNARDKRNQQPSFTSWMHAQIRARPRGEQPRSVYVALVQAKAQEWAARAVKPRGVPAAPAVDSGEGPSYQDRIGNTLWGLSTQASPIDPKAFEQVAREFAGPRHNPARAIGMTEAQAPLRATYVQSLVVHDAGEIPDSWKSSYTPTCVQLHPGFCRSSVSGDPHFSGDHAAFASLLRQCSVGTLFRLTASHGSGLDEISIDFVLANVDDSERLVLARCLTTDGVPSVATDQAKGIDFLMTQTLLKEVWRIGRPRSLRVVRFALTPEVASDLPSHLCLKDVVSGLPGEKRHIYIAT